MPVITQDTTLTDVEYILASGTGTLDFAVAGENESYTWHGTEDAEWTVSGVDRVENVDEDRFRISPDVEYLRCEIEASDSEGNAGPVRCQSQ